MEVEEFVVTNDLDNTINNNFLSLLGQNNVLDTLLFAGSKMSVSQVNGNLTILCAISDISFVECSLSKANYFVGPVTSGLIQELELIGVLSVNSSCAVYYFYRLSNIPTASLETTNDSQNSLTANRSVCYSNSVVKLFLLDFDRFLAVVP